MQGGESEALERLSKYMARGAWVRHPPDSIATCCVQLVAETSALIPVFLFPCTAERRELEHHPLILSLKFGFCGTVGCVPISNFQVSIQEKMDSNQHSGTVGYTSQLVCMTMPLQHAGIACAHACRSAASKNLKEIQRLSTLSPPPPSCPPTSSLDACLHGSSTGACCALCMLCHASSRQFTIFSTDDAFTVRCCSCGVV